MGLENMGSAQPANTTEEIDLDFTKPAVDTIETQEDFALLAEKKRQVQETIDGYNRILEKYKDQPDLIQKARERKEAFEATLRELENESPAPKEVAKTLEVADMDENLSATDRRINDNMDKWRSANQA